MPDAISTQSYTPADVERLIATGELFDLKGAATYCNLSPRTVENYVRTVRSDGTTKLADERATYGAEFLVLSKHQLDEFNLRRQQAKAGTDEQVAVETAQAIVQEASAGETSEQATPPLVENLEDMSFDKWKALLHEALSNPAGGKIQVHLMTRSRATNEQSDASPEPEEPSEREIMHALIDHAFNAVPGIHRAPLFHETMPVVRRFHWHAITEEGAVCCDTVYDSRDNSFQTSVLTE